MDTLKKLMELINRTYYLFRDVISIKDFDPSNIKIDEKS